MEHVVHKHVGPLQHIDATSKIDEISQLKLQLAAHGNVLALDMEWAPDRTGPQSCFGADNG